MKSRILSAALGLCVALISFSCKQEPGASGRYQILAVDSTASGIGGSSGRYHLFNGTYRFFDYRNNKSEIRASVFLLDTQTGETKIYHEGLNVDGGEILEWIRIPDQEDPLGILPDPKSRPPLDSFRKK